MATARSEARDEGAGGALNRTERQDAITRMVIEAGTIRVEELARAFGVSTMTVHRDLDQLAAREVLRRARGVVTAGATSQFEASTRYRQAQQTKAKRELSTAALEYVEPGQSVVLDNSTTGLYLARLLPGRQPLTIITNFQPALDELFGSPGIEVLSPGGRFYEWCDAFMGAMTVAALEQMRADVFFMSAPAIIDQMCFHQNDDTVLVKRAMFEMARFRVLYVDATKFGRRALHALLPLAAFDVVLVDSATDPAMVAAMRDKSVNVVVAPAVDEE